MHVFFKTLYLFVHPPFLGIFMYSDQFVQLKYVYTTKNLMLDAKTITASCVKYIEILWLLEEHTNVGYFEGINKTGLYF